MGILLVRSVSPPQNYYRRIWITSSRVADGLPPWRLERYAAERTHTFADCR
jgi:hypothetical protein